MIDVQVYCSYCARDFVVQGERDQIEPLIDRVMIRRGPWLFCSESCDSAHQRLQRFIRKAQGGAPCP